jgi:hypothetical protein
LLPRVSKELHTQVVTESSILNQKVKLLLSKSLHLEFLGEDLSFYRNLLQDQWNFATQFILIPVTYNCDKFDQQILNQLFIHRIDKVDQQISEHVAQLLILTSPQQIIQELLLLNLRRFDQQILHQLLLLQFANFDTKF